MFLGIQSPDRNFIRAKWLRRDQTRAEKVLWNELRTKRFHGYKFRRQTPIGPFIVDFFCFEKRLIIEVDGSAHWDDESQLYDRRREQYLREHGFQIVRFENYEVMNYLEDVLDKLKVALEVTSPRPSPGSEVPLP